VIQSAKAHLQQLEQQSIADGIQGDLFAARTGPEPKSDPVLEELEAIDPNELSPKAALEVVYRLKKLLGK